MRSVIVLIVLGGICLAHVAYGQGQGFGRKKEVVPAIRSDIKYIQCQFCRIAARHLHRTVADLRKDVPSWKRVTENDIQEHLEVACNTDKIEGEWLLKLDVQERQDELVLKEMSKQSQGFVGSETPRFAERGHAVQPGKCRRECRTMARMCEDIVGDHDTDLAELLLANPGRATVEQQLCYDLSSACVQKPPQFSGPRPDGEDFEEIDTEELGMLRMMATMQDQGMSGNLIDRASAMEQMNEYQQEMEDQGMSAEDISSLAGGMMGGGEL